MSNNKTNEEKGSFRRKIPSFRWILSKNMEKEQFFCALRGLKILILLKLISPPPSLLGHLEEYSNVYDSSRLLWRWGMMNTWEASSWRCLFSSSRSLIFFCNIEAPQFKRRRILKVVGIDVNTCSQKRFYHFWISPRGRLSKWWPPICGP